MLTVTDCSVLHDNMITVSHFMHVTLNETLCRYSPETRRNAPEAYPHIWFFDDTEKVCTKPHFSPLAREVLRHEGKIVEPVLSTTKIPASF